MRKLVSDHSFELAFVHHAEQSGRHRDHRMFFIAPGGKRIGLRIIDDIDAWLREPGSDRQILHDPMQLYILSRVRRICTRAHDRDAIGEPVRTDVHRKGDTRRYI